jgi:hypothetical protein
MLFRWIQKQPSYLFITTIQPMIHVKGLKSHFASFKSAANRIKLAEISTHSTAPIENIQNSSRF